jgi:hypothetical protein
MNMEIMRAIDMGICWHGIELNQTWLFSELGVSLMMLIYRMGLNDSHLGVDADACATYGPTPGRFLSGVCAR